MIFYDNFSSYLYGFLYFILAHISAYLFISQDKEFKSRNMLNVVVLSVFIIFGLVMYFLYRKGIIVSKTGVMLDGLHFGSLMVLGSLIFLNVGTMPEYYVAAVVIGAFGALAYYM